MKLPNITEFATTNGHMLYLVCHNQEFHTNLYNKLKDNGIHTAFYYYSLQKSDFYKDKHDGRELPEADMNSEYLLRLPVYYHVRNEKQNNLIKLLC